MEASLTFTVNITAPGCNNLKISFLEEKEKIPNMDYMLGDTKVIYDMNAWYTRTQPDCGPLVVLAAYKGRLADRTEIKNQTIDDTTLPIALNSKMQIII